MKKLTLAFLIAGLILIRAIPLWADDTALFTVQTPPDALIILDLSGSMNWTPAGNILYVSGTDCSIDGPFYGSSGSGNDYACTVPQSGGPIYGDSSCSGPFYKSSGSGHTTDCSRVGVAKRVISDVLDDNKDGSIDTKDETTLGLRLGYMRFYGCGSDTGNDYNSGCNTMIKPINTSYSDIWNSVKNESASGGTPLAFALNEAKLYLDATKVGDPSGECRQKFVILITDGEDTLACDGTGNVNQSGDYKRRRETAAKAKELTDAGYKVFVVGFGARMPHYLKNTLNWVARYGGTDNPLEADSGNPKGYDPSKVTSCQDSSESSHNLGEGTHYYATSNDPGETPLSGYAFLAENSSELGRSLTSILQYIQGKSFSFVSPTIPLVRIIDKDAGYVSSFIPNNTSYWKGNLKGYRLMEDGTFPVDAHGNPLDANLIWDASAELKKIIPGDRKIFTYVNGALKDFIYDNLANADLDVSSDTERANLVNHIRGIDTYDINQNGNTAETRDWLLGDIFHSNAVSVGPPSQSYEDEGFNGPGGFYGVNKDRTKIVIVGANDGMLHAFNATTGREEWAFIPNSLLKNLKRMTSAHTYYVDSSPKVSDVWFYSDPADKTKSADEWRTVLICGLRKGGKSYFALDVTDTLNPTYLWEFPKSSDTATLAKAGQSWSEPVLGRVKIEAGGGLYERWVAFIGGGFDPSENNGQDATLGRAFFAVDIKTGEIIWEFSYEDKVEVKKDMTHSMAAPPTAVDTNDDGYVDKVYTGDLGGQMWVFSVSFDEESKTSNSNWTGKKLFQAPENSSEKHPIYYQPAVTFDKYGAAWVYFGTGDRENPTEIAGPEERIYAVKDDGLGNYPRTENDLKDVTSVNTFNQDNTKKGWFIKLEKTGQHKEKVLAKPAIFNRLVYFTTYTYKIGDPCSIAGVAKLYTVEYLSGGGASTVAELLDLSKTPSQRSVEIGTGIPSPPVISVNLKGLASVTIGTTTGQLYSKQAFSPKSNKQGLYWREAVR